MADVPHFLLLLTAREDHTWFDHLAAGNKLGSMSPAPLPGGWRRRVPAGHRRRCWQRQNWLKWRHFIPALTLRGMHTGTVAQVEENLHKYFESINIGSEQPQPLSLLMRSIVLRGELKHLTPGMMTDVYLAIVFGRKFPRVLLAKAIGRCQAEQKVTRERAALVRAYLIRNLEVEVTVGLDKKKLSAGYRLGRLMAVLERVQGAAQNNPNKTIVDRYYGAASTRPATIFPRLIALAQHHLAKLTTGLQVFYGSRLGEVMDGLSVFPATLNLEEQGLFALGYYHQKQDFFKKRENGAAETDGESTEGEAA